MKGDCTIWNGLVSGRGYGVEIHKGITRGAHRMAYCRHHGIAIESINGVIIRHRCDNPLCVNPAHLVRGTHKQNMRDKVKRNRQAKGVTHGQVKLTEFQVLEIRRLYVRQSQIFGQNALAKMFGISQTVVSDILSRKIWRHL